MSIGDDEDFYDWSGEASGRGEQRNILDIVYSSYASVLYQNTKNVLKKYTCKSQQYFIPFALMVNVMSRESGGIQGNWPILHN